MDVREKLVELLNKANSAFVGTDCFEGCKFYMENDCLYKLMADVMIENGVTVQELDGCEYCKDSESVYHHSSGIHDSMDEDVYISGNNIVVDIGCHSYGTAEIKFCPMCGRRLPQPPKGE